MMKLSTTVLMLVFLVSLQSGTAMCAIDPATLTEEYGSAIVLILASRDTNDVRLGTGFIVSENGTIMTNYHVIATATPVIVKLANGDIYRDVMLLHEDRQKDIAIIKISAFGLPKVLLGNSNDARVGSSVVVIGNPRGYEQSVTNGLLSQIRRADAGYSLFQISAPISPGSSGSPVFGQDGTVIGIAAMTDVSGQNLNFAIPINYARGLMEVNEEPRPISKQKTTDVGNRDGLGVPAPVAATECFSFIQEIARTLFWSVDRVWEAAYITPDPHRKRFQPAKYHIHPGFYTAKENFADVLKKLHGNRCSNVSEDSLNSILTEQTALAVEGLDMAIGGLELESSNAFPNWDQMNRGITKFDKGSGIAKSAIRTWVNRLPDSLRSGMDRNLLCDCEWAGISHDSLLLLPALGVRFASTGSRVTVVHLTWNFPAYDAGIEVGDVLLGEKGGPDMQSNCDYYDFIRKHRAGDKVVFRVLRQGKVLTKTVVFAQR